MTLKIGDRVELQRDVERYPQFIAKKGLQGTIAKKDDEVFAVKMDKRLKGAEEWDNCIEWYATDDSFDDIPKDLKVI